MQKYTDSVDKYCVKKIAITIWVDNFDRVAKIMELMHEAQHQQMRIPKKRGKVNKYLKFLELKCNNTESGLLIEVIEI